MSHVISAERSRRNGVQFCLMATDVDVIDNTPRRIGHRRSAKQPVTDRRSCLAFLGTSIQNCKDGRQG